MAMAEHDPIFTFQSEASRRAEAEALRDEAHRTVQESARLRAVDDMLDVTRQQARQQASADARQRRLDAADAAEQMAAETDTHRINNLLRALDASGPDRAKLRQLAQTAHHRSQDFRDIARELRNSVTRVNEPAPYGPGSPHSYFGDLMAVTSVEPAEGRQDAAERLERHGRAVGREALDPSSRAARALRDATRKPADLRMASADEFRAVTSGSGSAGAFVSPTYLDELYAKYRAFVPAVAEACQQVDLPPYGLDINVPAVTGPASAGAQSAENAAATSSTFSATLRTATLVTYVGTVEVSQQLLDRTGPGAAFDRVVWENLRQQVDQAVDSAVIAAMLAGATTNLTRATWSSMADLYADTNHAASTLETTEGLALPATHLFVPGSTWRWLAAQVDSQNRPILTPDTGSAPNWAAGFTGYNIAGTGLYTDNSLPTQNAGADATLMVANPASTLLVAGEPVVQVVPQPDAETLSAIVRLYRYAVAVPRYPAAAASITGAAYPATPTWA